MIPLVHGGRGHDPPVHEPDCSYPRRTSAKARSFSEDHSHPTPHTPENVRGHAQTGGPRGSNGDNASACPPGHRSGHISFPSDDRAIYLFGLPIFVNATNQTQVVQEALTVRYQKE